MQLPVGEKRGGFFLTEFFKSFSDDFVVIDENGVCSVGGLFGPVAVIVGGGAGDLAVFPTVSGSEGEDDRDGASGLNVGDVLSHVPAKAVNDLVLFGEDVVDFLGFLADAFDAGAGAEIVVDGAAIILAELDDGEIAFLN